MFSEPTLPANENLDWAAFYLDRYGNIRCLVHDPFHDSPLTIREEAVAQGRSPAVVQLPSAMPGRLRHQLAI